MSHLGGIFFQDSLVVDADTTSSSKGNNGGNKGAYTDRENLYFSLTYTATVMLCFTANVVVTVLCGPNYAEFSPIAIALQHVGYGVLEMGVLLFHLRQVKFAAVTRLVSDWLCWMVLISVCVCVCVCVLPFFIFSSLLSPPTVALTYDFRSSC